MPTQEPALGALVCADAAGRGKLAQEAAKLGLELRTALARDTSTAMLRAAGLLELAAGAGDQPATERAVLRLEEVAVRNSTNAPALRDAASAQVIAGAAGLDATRLLRALDLIERASLLDTSDVTVQYNRSLILELVGLAGESAASWSKLLSSRDVRREAQQRFELQHQRDGQAPGRQRLDTALRVGLVPDSLLIQLLADDPASLREYAVDVGLPQWGQARDAAPLRLVQRIGATLAGKGDRTVSAAVQVADRHRASKRLSAGLAAYGRGRAWFNRGEFEQAAPELETALGALSDATVADPEGVALWGWPAIYLGAYEVYARHYERADRLFERVLDAAGGAPLYALQGRAFWGVALSLARQDHPQQSIELYRQAIVRFERIGESGNVGALEYQLADMYALTGDAAKAAGAMVRASHAFRAPRISGTLQDFLEAFATFELRSGRPHGALAILREAVRVSTRTGRAKDVPEALARLAAAEVQIGNTASAKSHLAEARSSLAAVSSELMRRGVEIELEIVEARLAQGAPAIDALDRVAAYYRDQGIPFSLAPILVRRADARLAVGDTVAAERDLDSALAIVQRRAQRLDAVQAASAREVERSVFEHRVALRIRQGDAEGALARLDDQRTWRTGASGPVARIATRLRRDEAIVAYAALPDQLVIWTLTDEGITSRATPVAARELMRRAGRLEALLGAGGDPQVLRVESEGLYRILLGPVDSLLRQKRRIGIVADPLLAGVPFAALRSPSSGGYLVEDFTLHHGFGVWDALAGFTSPPPSSGGSVRVVGNPAFDRSREPALQPLRHAAAEADSVMTIHPGARRLDGEMATPRTVVAALNEASLFHFAGHARAAASGLQGSRLLLAPDAPSGDGSLSAERIATLRIPGLRLAILSACETLGRNQPGISRFDGLAEAFLAAGAGGVIGSLWAVDDAGTIRLMARLHRALSAGLAPAKALQTAQLEALREADGTVGLRTWAAFRYVTR